MLALSALLCLLAHVARAQDDLALHWHAPSSCPSQDSVHKTVSSWLALSQGPAALSGIEVEANVTRDPRGFVLDLKLVTPVGRAREQLVAERCDTLAGVVALKVALAADPIAVVSAADKLQPLAAGPLWGVRLALAASSVALPRLGPTLSAAGLLRLGGSFALELSVGYGFRQEILYPDRPSIGGKLDVLRAGARACVLPALGRIEFSLCAGPELGVIRGVGVGLETTYETRQLYFALALGPAIRLQLARGWFAYFGMEAQLALVRPSFQVRNLSLLFQPEELAAGLSAGIELHFD